MDLLPIIGLKFLASTIFLASEDKLHRKISRNVMLVVTINKHSMSKVSVHFEYHMFWRTNILINYSTHLAVLNCNFTYVYIYIYACICVHVPISIIFINLPYKFRIQNYY
jgi:hypothetical protein